MALAGARAEAVDGGVVRAGWYGRVGTGSMLRHRPQSRPHAPTPPLTATVLHSAPATAPAILAPPARLVAGFPLDAAADTGVVIARDGLIAEHCVERGPQVAAGHGNAVAGAAVIELAAVHELAMPIEQKEVGRARCLVGFRDFLSRIEQIRERIAGFPFLFTHAFW